MLSRHEFATTAQARATVIDWCYGFYNHQRRHSAAAGAIAGTGSHGQDERVSTLILRRDRSYPPLPQDQVSISAGQRRGYDFAEALASPGDKLLDDGSLSSILPKGHKG